MTILRVASVLGNDLSIVNAARSSFAVEHPVLTAADTRLLRSLWREGHSSPFRHGAIRFTLVTSVADRLRWEHLGGDRAGTYCYPGLDYLADLACQPNEWLSWRWTASVHAIARFLDHFTGHASLGDAADQVATALAWAFPYSAQAIRGTPVPADLTPEQIRLTREPVRLAVGEHGYVRLVDWLEGPTPAECLLSFEVQATRIDRDQWFKHVQRSDQDPPVFWHPLEGDGTSGNGSDGHGTDPLYARNEASRRYIRDLLEWDIPTEWQAAPEHRKQGHDGFVDDETARTATFKLQQIVGVCQETFEWMLANQIAPQQARRALPQCFETNWRWTASLPAVQHFLSLRLGHGAQLEIQQYAAAVRDLTTSVFPDAVRGIGGAA